TRSARSGDTRRRPSRTRARPTSGRGRSATPPCAAWREQIVSEHVQQRRDTIAPRDLLAFGVRAAAVGDGQLPDAGAGLRQPCRELDLDPEALRRERQALEEVRPDELVARLHV